MLRMKCPGGFGKMNTGHITNEIRTAIRSIISIEKHLDAVFGFGSFFRGEPFRDIDVLAVTSSGNTELLRTYYLIIATLSPIAAQLGRPIHLIMFTPDEFNSWPLRDMRQLQTLWTSD